jgi:hypothetical protein
MMHGEPEGKREETPQHGKKRNNIKTNFVQFNSSRTAISNHRVKAAQQEQQTRSRSINMVRFFGALLCLACAACTTEALIMPRTHVTLRMRPRSMVGAPYEDCLAFGDPRAEVTLEIIFQSPRNCLSFFAIGVLQCALSVLIGAHATTRVVSVRHSASTSRCPV